jgi:hypothetical protein
VAIGATAVFSAAAVATVQRRRSALRLLVALAVGLAAGCAAWLAAALAALNFCSEG